jgi:hypothetical protein
MRYEINSEFEYAPSVASVSLFRQQGTLGFGAVLDLSLTKLIGMFKPASDFRALDGDTVPRFNVKFFEVYLEVRLLLWCLAIEVNLPYKVVQC